MTVQQFKEFAERIVSKDVTRPALRSAFRWYKFSIVADGRIALVVDKAFDSLPVASGDQVSIAASLIAKIMPDIDKKMLAGKYGHFVCDIDLLERAAQAVEKDLEPDMAKLRHHEADPYDPDDVDSEDSERYVYQTCSQIIMPDKRRTVVAGYYARLVADICLRCGRSVSAVADQKLARSTLLFLGSGWRVFLQPLYLRDEGNPFWFSNNAIADARTGELVWSHSNGGQCRMRSLRFPHPRPDVITIDDPQPKESEATK